MAPPTDTTTSRARSASLKRQRGGSQTFAQAQCQRSLSQKKKAKLEAGEKPLRQSRPKLGDKHYEEYAMNRQRLIFHGLTNEKLRDLENGLDEEGIVKMQRERLSSLGVRLLAPKPSVNTDKKGGPSR